MNSYKFQEFEGEVTEKYFHYESMKGIRGTHYFIIKAKYKSKNKEEEEFLKFEAYKKDALMDKIEVGYEILVKAVMRYKLYGEAYTKDRGDGKIVASGGWEIKPYDVQILNKPEGVVKFGQANKEFEYEVGAETEDDLPF